LGTPPTALRNPTDSSGITKDQPEGRETGELKGLVDTKVPALLIPADSTRNVREIEFDLDRLWRFKVVRYDRGRVFLTKENAKRDELKSNSLASEWVQLYSDAAKDPDSRLATPEKLYGDVYVLPYEPLLEMITDQTTQLTKLKTPSSGLPPSGDPTDSPKPSSGRGPDHSTRAEHRQRVLDGQVAPEPHRLIHDQRRVRTRGNIFTGLSVLPRVQAPIQAA
jgi:hypothetical protein